MSKRTIAILLVCLVSGILPAEQSKAGKVETLLRDSDNAEAYRLAMMELQSSPDDVRLAMAAGTAALRIRAARPSFELDEVAGKLEHAVRIEPTRPSLNLLYGMALLRTVDDADGYRRAAEHFAAETKIRPDSVRAREGWHLALTRIAAHDEAVEVARAWVELPAASDGAHAALVSSLIAAERAEEALDWTIGLRRTESRATLVATIAALSHLQRTQRELARRFLEDVLTGAEGELVRHARALHAACWGSIDDVRTSWSYVRPPRQRATVTTLLENSRCWNADDPKRTEPQRIADSYVAPEFPPKGGTGARVNVIAWVDESGAVTVLHTFSSPPGLGFEEATEKAVSQWRYRPATDNGRPIGRMFMIEVDFSRW